MIKLSERSISKLHGVHPDLVKVVKRAAEISDMDFVVLEGMRTLARQKELVAKGASKTLNSRHLTGDAVDLAPTTGGKVSWDWPLYYKLEKVVKRAAKDVGVTIEWGGDWKSFKDGPHWQLPFSKYPKKVTVAGVESEAPYTLETDKQAQGKALAALGTGAVTSGSIASEPLVRVVEVVTEQQSELSSGDWLRMSIALIILAASIWFTWKKLK